VLLICSVIARGVLGSSYCLEADPERVTDERYCHPELTSTIVVLPVLGACASALALVVVLTKIVRRRTLERAG
jgi:hypothetical protein